MTEPSVHAAGQGPPAVLVHGTFVGGPESWTAQASLADHHRLLVVDRRGYGANPAPTGILGWPVDGQDLLGLVEQLGGAHLVGHSYGGAVVAVAAGWMAGWGEREWALAEEPDRFNDLLRGTWAVPEPGGRW